MRERRLPRLQASAWLSALSVALMSVACGGGGGGAGSGAGEGASGANATPPPASAPAGQIGAVAWLQSSVRVERDIFSTSPLPAVTASLSMQGKGLGYWYRYSYDKSLVNVGYSARTVDEGMDFSINFVTYPARAAGSYTDVLSVMICYDEACAREVAGSPFNLPIRLDVGYLAKSEEGVTPWVPTQTTVLNHDVLGAAYSAALDAVITVSALPEPRLRVHDLRTGLTRTLPLLTAPTSVSIGADGLQAAVGHDAAVSLVDLRVDAPAPVRRLDVPAPVGSVLLAGSRIVAIGAQANTWNDIYWVDTLSGTASKTSSFGIFGAGDVLLHPAGDRIYLAEQGLSPDDVRRMDLVGDAASAKTNDTRYHGEYSFCGRAAISPDGRRLYTGCGVVLSTAALLADDMLYAGQMTLSPRDPVSYGFYRSAALSVAPDNASVALLEENQSSCNPRIERLSDCYTRVAVYDSKTLERRSLRGLVPYERGSERLQQWGRRVMHRADGSLIVIAEVRTSKEATPTWLMHRLKP